eukprot:s14_g32.t1
MAPSAARKSQQKTKKGKRHAAPRKRKAVGKRPTAWKRAADKLVACQCTLLSLLAFAMPYLTVSGQEDEIGRFQACFVFGHAFRHSLHMLGSARTIPYTSWLQQMALNESFGANVTAPAPMPTPQFVATPQFVPQQGVATPQFVPQQGVPTPQFVPQAFPPGMPAAGPTPPQVVPPQVVPPMVPQQGMPAAVPPQGVPEVFPQQGIPVTVTPPWRSDTAPAHVDAGHGGQGGASVEPAAPADTSSTEDKAWWWDGKQYRSWQRGTSRQGSAYARKDQLALRCISADCLCELDDGQPTCKRQVVNEMYRAKKGNLPTPPEHLGDAADNRAAK